MSLNISFKTDYLLVEISGVWTEASMRSYLDRAHFEAMKYKVLKLLFDLRELSDPNSEMLRYYAGQHLSQVLGYPYKIAVIARKEMYNQFGENVAINRAAHLKVFFQEMPAVEWLLL